MRVLLAGVLSPTGQLVARQLDSDYRVYALCASDMHSLIKDDNGPLAATNVLACGGAGMKSDVPVDALVIATDDAPPIASLKRLLSSCKAVDHTILLSRLGASTGRGGLDRWQEVEEIATACCPNLTICRLGEPLLGGPYYAREVDQIRWRTNRVADYQLAAQVATGDTLSQSGFGSSRIVAASAIASALRRGPEGQCSYSVISSEGEATPPETYDAFFAQAAGTVAGTSGSTGAQTAQVEIDLSDELLGAFTKPYTPPPPTPLELLKASFFGNPAVAGPNWFILIFFVGGMYQCTLPDYIQKTGVDVFGLAPKYGIVLGS